MAISVLIITCPCALGLAVPMVQVVAARRLLARGVALKDGSALERLCEVDTAVFDKTGTLTVGELRLIDCTVAGTDLGAAAALAQRSRHPVARAIAPLGRGGIDVEDFAEFPGQGIEGRIGRIRYRLGRPDWALSQPAAGADPGDRVDAVLSRDGVAVGSFEFADQVRPAAPEAIAALSDRGLRTEILSGDRRRPVSELAAALGVDTFRCALLPREKVERLEELRRAGRKTLMIGDGLNDAPALSAAHVSMAPASAAEVGRAAADLVFFGRDLMAVPEALEIAGTARRLVRQNLAFAVGYNLLVIPVAVAGHVTPLIAAAVMSLSSILVVANALRFPTATARRSAEGAPRATPGRTLEVAQ